jgi:hypothetical protein
MAGFIVDATGDLNMAFYISTGLPSIHSTRYMLAFHALYIHFYTVAFHTFFSFTGLLSVFSTYLSEGGLPYFHT